MQSKGKNLWDRKIWVGSYPIDSDVSHCIQYCNVHFRNCNALVDHTHTHTHTNKIKYIIQGLHTVLIFFINWSSCIQGMKKRCNNLYPSPLFRCFVVLFLHIHNYHINVFLIHNTLSTPMTAYLLIPKDKLQQEVILTTHFQVLSYMCYLPRYISLQLHINNNKNPPYCKSKTNMSNICFILKSAMLLILGWNTVWILNVLSIIFFSPESSLSDWVM